jgi:hypothetical protein
MGGAHRKSLGYFAYRDTEITTGRVNLFLGFGLPFCHQVAAASRGVGQRPVLLYSKLVGEFAKHATNVRKSLGAFLLRNR